MINKFSVTATGFLIAFCLAKGELQASDSKNTDLSSPISQSSKISSSIITNENYDEKESKAHVLFLCTGNTCRSQLAEAWAKHLGGSSIIALSAGINARDLNPRTVSVLQESGIDTKELATKTVTPDMVKWADLVVAVSPEANENCPALPENTRKEYWSIPDPTKATGTDEEIMSQFRAVNNEIQKHVAELVQKSANK